LALKSQDELKSEGTCHAKSRSKSLRAPENVANILATLRVVKLSPSESLKPSLQAYVVGQKTTDDLLNEIKAKSRATTRMISIASQTLLILRTKLG